MQIDITSYVLTKNHRSSESILEEIRQAGFEGVATEYQYTSLFGNTKPAVGILWITLWLEGGFNIEARQTLAVWKRVTR